MEISDIVAQRIRIARANPQTIPAWWDRDCRVCMAWDNHDLWEKRGIWKAGETTYIWDRTSEEFHDWHTDADLARYDAELDRLSPEVKKRMGIE